MADRGTDATRPPRRSGGRRRTGTAAPAAAALLGAAALLLCLSPPASAQDAAGDTAYAGADAPVLLDAGVGLLTPLANLAPSDEGGASTAPRPAPSLSVAVSASVNAVYLLSPRLGVGLHGAWSRPDVDLERVVGGSATPEGSRSLGTADFLAATAEVVFRPLAAPGGAIVDPYLAAGAGLRRFSFSEPSLDDSTDPVGTAAAGARTSLGDRIYWLLEVRGFVSSTDPTARGSRVQHDIVVTVGLGTRL